MLLVLALGGLLALGVWRWDAGQAQRLAPGTRVAGVEVGGMQLQQARAHLQAKLHERLRPTEVRGPQQQWQLAPAAVSLYYQPQTALDAALAAGRAGSLPGRLLRRLRGWQLRRDFAVPARWQPRQLQSWTRRVARQLYRAPQEGQTHIRLRRVWVSAPRPGQALRRRQLQRELAYRLQGGGGGVVPARTQTLKPRQSLQQLRRQVRVVLTVDRAQRRLRLFRSGRLVRSFPVAVGMPGLETPAGLFRITDKSDRPVWNVPQSAWAGSLAGQTIPYGDPGNPIRARWMGFFDGAGLHGTADLGSLGSAASHGCVRMNPQDIIWLYPRVPIGTPILVS